MQRAIVVIPTYNEAENLHLLVPQVLEQDPVPPRLVNPQADADLEMITLK